MAPMSAQPAKKQPPKAPPDVSKNWTIKCENCQQVPTVGKSRLCGPCYFGEADTANGEW